jgi:hypothetical protein
MAVQLGVLTRNVRLDAVETQLGTAPLLTIRTLAPPANCAAANVGVVLATINLPSDWMATATGGTKSIAGGPWQDVSADASGTAAHFRIHNTAGTVCEMQGTVGQGTGDLQLDNTSIVAGQTISITAFTLTDGNA